VQELSNCIQTPRAWSWYGVIVHYGEMESGSIRSGARAQAIVFVLGAGFSRAISHRMPLTDDLGHSVLDSLRDRLPPRLAIADFPRGLNFEEWLSQLAADQPFLSDAENAQNRAAFLLFSEGIASILGDRVNDVLMEDYPEWLLQFVSAAHHSRATVVTFNYDPLVECMVATPTGILGNPSRYGEVWQGVSWTELSGGLPSWAPGDARLGSERVETLRLLKLHGSLNWYWRAGDESGVSVARRSLPGHFRKPVPYSEEERRREVPGRSPFVVPPASSKSAYYLNPIIKEMWTQAAERLQGAHQVVIIGYSLPQTDVTFSTMLRQSLLDRDCDVTVVDFNPGPVRQRLLDLGIEGSRIDIIGSGDTAVEEFVDRWTAEQSTKVLEDLGGIAGGDRSLLMAWGDGAAYSPVETLEVGPRAVTLSGTRIYNSVALATGLNSRPAMTIGEAVNRLDGCDTTSLSLQAKAVGTEARPVVGVQDYATNIGRGSGKWILLQVAATPPSASER
jgi:hypothetical protein